MIFKSFYNKYCQFSFINIKKYLVRLQLTVIIGLTSVDYQQSIIRIWTVKIRIGLILMALTLMANSSGLLTSRSSPVGLGVFNVRQKNWMICKTDFMIVSWNAEENRRHLKFTHQQLTLTLNWFYDFKLKCQEKLITLALLDSIILSWNVKKK